MPGFLKQWNKRVQELIRFVSYGIWRIDDLNIPDTKKGVRFRIAKTVILAYNGFFDHRLLQKAAALTYYTALSMIPFLALIFGVAKVIGAERLIESELFKLLPEDIGQTDKIVEIIHSYLQYAESSVFIGLGIGFLVWSGISLITNMELSINDIWEIKQIRPYYRQLLNYIVLVVVAPILVILSSSLSIFFTSELPAVFDLTFTDDIIQVFSTVVPFFAITLILWVVYTLLPKIKVNFINAIIPAIIAGIAFQSFQLIYINGQLWVSRYNALYGGFAAVPLLLLWIQVSWLIVLIGAELSFAMQNIKYYNFQSEVDNISDRFYSFLILSVTSLIFKRTEEESDPYTIEELSRTYGIPLLLTGRIIDQLKEINIIKESPKHKNGRATYEPSVNIDQISVATLFDKLDQKGSERFDINKAEFQKPWMMVLKSRQAIREAGKDTLVKDL